jgi:hypothetical protein
MRDQVFIVGRLCRLKALVPKNMNDKVEIERWAITANIKKEIPFGPGDKETKIGTNHFKGGAKVYIIGAYFGMCEDIIAVGQHRKTGKYVRCVIRANNIENMRVKQLYRNSILEMLEDYQPGGALITTSKKESEDLMNIIPVWCDKYL